MDNEQNNSPIRVAIAEYFSFTMIVIVVAFCYTFGYFDLYKIPQAIGLESTVAFYFRSILETIVESKATIFCHIFILVGSFAVPHCLSDKKTKFKILGLLTFVLGAGFSSYWLGKDFFQKRDLPVARYTAEEPDSCGQSGQKNFNRHLAYASESGVFYWLACRVCDDVTELYLEGINGGNSTYRVQLNSDQLYAKFCQ
jgi:hypothetical protein